MDRKLVSKSTKIGITIAVLIIILPAIWFVIGGLMVTNKFTETFYIIIGFHMLIGLLYSVFKYLSEDKRKYTISFALTILMFGIFYIAISLRFFTNDIVSTALTSLYLVYALLGVIVYEALAFLLKLISKKRKVERSASDKSSKSVIFTLAISLILNLTMWLPERFIWTIGIGIINIVGMAIVDIVRRAEEKQIPIIMFIGLNSVLIPINFGLAHWMF